MRQSSAQGLMKTTRNIRITVDAAEIRSFAVPDHKVACQRFIKHISRLRIMMIVMVTNLTR